MNMYKQIKATVTTRQAAEDYGLAVGRSGMALCPFHEDHHPSLKLDRRYYCFGCGESGDVIDFTARYFGISNQSAAIQLARNYGIDSHPQAELNIPTENAEPFPDEEQPCILSLTREVQRLRHWKWECAPKDPEGPWDPRFVEACRELDGKEYLLDLQLDPSAWRPNA